MMDSLLAHQAEKIEKLDAAIRALDSDEAARKAAQKDQASERAHRIMSMLDDWIPLSASEPLTSPVASPPPRKTPQVAIAQQQPEGLPSISGNTQPAAESSYGYPASCGYFQSDAALTEPSRQTLVERDVGITVDRVSTAASDFAGALGRVSAAASDFAAAGSTSPETAPPQKVNAPPPPATAPPQSTAAQLAAPLQVNAPFSAVRGISSAGSHAGSTNSSRAPGSTMSSRGLSTTSSAARSTPRTATAARARVEALQAALGRTDAYAKRRR